MTTRKKENDQVIPDKPVCLDKDDEWYLNSAWDFSFDSQEISTDLNTTSDHIVSTKPAYAYDNPAFTNASELNDASSNHKIMRSTSMPNSSCEYQVAKFKSNFVKKLY